MVSKAEGTSEPICPIEFRYGRRESRQIFSRSAALKRNLSVEAALATALSEQGRIPAEGAKAISAAVSGGRVTLQRVDDLEKETKHDIMALVRALSEVSGPGASYVHLGATSNDILDTSRGLEMRDAVELLQKGLDEVMKSLAREVRAHKGTVMAGRTHGQQAVPTTFGYKLANILLELSRHSVRLEELSKRLVVGKMSGAVGTGASFGDSASVVEARVMELLGLYVDRAPTQVTGRDRLAEFSFWMAMVASTLDRLATEVRNLQRTEIGELSEAFDEKGQVGSSTMAQKRNPVSAENVCSLARLMRSFPQVALENMVQWHERDLANSANERFLYSHGVIILDDMLLRTKGIVDGWHVNADRMRKNMALGGGAIMTESLMLELSTRGLARQDAHELLRTLTRDLKEGGDETLLDRALSDRTVRKFMRADEVRRCLSPESYAKAAEKKVDRLLADRKSWSA